MSSLCDALANRAASNDATPLILDGAIGTELDARGFSTDRIGWSAAATWEAPELLAAIHRDYVTAGADIVTANTFRMHRRSLSRLAPVPQDAVAQSVAVARAACSQFVVGSIGPLEDCYQPDLTPTDHELAQEHSLAAERLSDACVDGILLETMPTYREAAAALAACRRVGMTTLVSLWPSKEATLGDGVLLAEAARRLADSGATAVLINCVPAEDVSSLLSEIRGSSSGIGAYANTGRLVNDKWHPTAAASPQAYGQFASQWAAEGACLVGGCCGTAPAHIREVQRMSGSLTRPEQTP